MELRTFDYYYQWLMGFIMFKFGNESEVEQIDNLLNSNLINLSNHWKINKSIKVTIW